MKNSGSFVTWFNVENIEKEGKIMEEDKLIIELTKLENQLSISGECYINIYIADRDRYKGIESRVEQLAKDMKEISNKIREIKMQLASSVLPPSQG